MLTALTWITFALAIVYVAVLAITLILAALHLLRAARLARRLAGGLETVDEQTAKLPQYLTTINGALTQLLAGLRSVDGHYANLAKRAGLER